MKYVITANRSEWTYGAVRGVLEKVDTKQAVIGAEIGRHGYQHWQMCVDCAGDLRKYNDNNNCGWHIEDCVTWHRAVMYCRKEGCYHDIGFRDSRWLHKSRLPVQNLVLEHVNRANDRQITVWVDEGGRIGKSSLLYDMARRGRVLPIPRTEQDPVKLNDFCAMMYEDEDIICLDLPKNGILSKKQAEALESIKDGLLVSAKYEGKIKLCKGVNVLVLTNHKLPKETYDALTKDRWDIIIS